MLIDNSASKRRLFSVVCALSMLLVSMPTSHAAPRKGGPTIEPYESFADQDGTFEKVWLEHNFSMEGRRGMRIHAKFTVKNSLNVQCRLIAYFFTRDGEPLIKDKEDQNRTYAGQVVTYDDVKPAFNIANYSDTTLFIPYREFNITKPGVHPLKFVLVLERGPQRIQIGRSADVNFKYTKS